MVKNDSLGDRMKGFYEGIPKTRLMRRCPVAIRIDGKAFHTFTRGFQKPFDDVLIGAMQDTMKYLCENIQGCVLGYTQSDEITLILIDYKNLDSQAWFDYEVQKMCSVSASMATMEFNKSFAKRTDEYARKYVIDIDCGEDGEGLTEEEMKILGYWSKYYFVSQNGAMFDSRCFNIPKEEVTNLLYWRQLDATRNSIQMVGRANFSHKELMNKSCNDIKDMLANQKNINWNDFPIYQKRGSCCKKAEGYGWAIDEYIPIFKGDGRSYVEELVNVGE